MSGKYLVYELANYVESTLDLDLTFNIDQGGTEELLPSSLMNGFVDLGSLTWNKTSGTTPEYDFFETPSTIPTPSGTLNVLCPLYKTVNAMTSSSGENKAVRITGASSIRIRDLSYTDANSFTQAMQGVYLWYEKTDSTPTTSPILCDIFYRGMIPVSVNVYPLGSGTVTGSGEYRYGETATLVATSNDGIYRFLRYEDENGQTLSTDSTYSFKVGE
jgi:hypothetical protein